MHTITHFVDSNQKSFVSPLRLINQNTIYHNGPLERLIEKPILSENQRIKKRIMQTVQHNGAHHIHNIKIRYKENMAFQADPIHFQSKNESHVRQAKPVHSLQFQTVSARPTHIAHPYIRSISINPFEIQPSIEINVRKEDQNHGAGCLGQKDFQRLKQLGKGKFGTVWLVKHKASNFICAMKIIQKAVVRSENVEHQVAKEIRIHNTLRHANIIDFYGYFHDQHHFYILTEYATGGSVYSLIKKQFRLIEEQVVPIVSQAVEGLEFMHSLGYIHRDIKPENLILQFGTIKICDLGWAAECARNEMRKSICGTPLYYSPEIVRQGEHNGLIDVWSLGVLTYQLLVGRIPFKIWSQFDLPVILEQQVMFPEYIDFEEDTKDFILACLAKSTAQRPSLSALLAHSFLLRVKRREGNELYEQGRALLS